MRAFTFQQFTGAMFLAGGTTLVDLMKIDVLTPDTIVDVRPLQLSSIDVIGMSDELGVGELAIAGMASAIANAVYHATGTRVRSLPISIEKVLGHESSSPRAS